eukprot:scaffold8008_cov430-Prasinococcus_capsulatus_cf.AAC.1
MRGGARCREALIPNRTVSALGSMEGCRWPHHTHRGPRARRQASSYKGCRGPSLLSEPESVELAPPVPAWAPSAEQEEDDADADADADANADDSCGCWWAGALAVVASRA